MPESPVYAVHFFLDDFARLIASLVEEFMPDCRLDWAGVMLLGRETEAYLVRLLRRAHHTTRGSRRAPQYSLAGHSPARRRF